MKNILILFIFSFSTFLFAQEKAIDSNYQSGELLVQLYENRLIDDFIADFYQQNKALPGLHIKNKTVPRLNIFLLNFDDQNTDISTMLEVVKAHPFVAAAQLNYRLTTRDSIPNDPLSADQWSLQRIQAPDVWSFSTGGQSVRNDEIVIAVVDSGFDIEHEDLQANLWQNEAEIPFNGIDDDSNGFVDDINGWNFLNNLPQHPITSHGTAVVGILGAKGNNNLGVTGVNWNVKLMLMTANFSEQIAAAYGYALDQRILYNETNGEQGAFVVVTNASLGINNIFCEEQPVWGAMYDPLGEAGIVSVAATTNNRSTNVDTMGDMPTSCPSDYLITVTNSNFEEEREGGFGATAIDLAAPGTGSTTLNTGGNYNTNFGGTSAACPHVAGGVALLFSLPCPDLGDLIADDPAASALLMKEAILEGTEKLDALNGETVSGGRLNLFGSAQYLNSYCVAKDFERSQDTFADTYIGDAGFIRVYAPDASGNRLLIDFSTMNFDPINIAVYNVLGQLIYKDVMRPDAFVSQTFELDVNDWATGAYFISVTGISSKVTAKFLKN